MKINSVILAQSTPTIAPPSSQYPLAEWGLTGAVVFLCLQKGWQWFNTKEDSESRLIHSLIQSLQDTQSQLLKQLVETQTNTNTAINGLKSAVEALGQQIKVETAQIAQSNHLAIREISARLDRLDAQFPASDDEPTVPNLRNYRQYKD